jgi:lysozyme
MRNGCLIISGSIAVILIITAIFIYRIFFIPNGIEIDKNNYPITGIDISEHTGKVDFLNIKNQEIDFVYIKATEGICFIDPKFEENYIGASNYGLNIGFYHFFRFDKDGALQAANFLKNVKGKGMHLPLVIDVEEWGNKWGTSKENVIHEIRKFIANVEKESGKQVMIYSNESSFKKYIKENFDKNDVWICSFSKKPNIDKQWTLWQHSHKGKFDGTDGWVDINTFNGNRDEWDRYLKK